MVNPRNDKRSRLVNAAVTLFHQQGVSITTLANIAQLADVPLGNVYYYFKSKGAIIMAVITHIRKSIQQQFDEFNLIESPLSRLKAFIRQITADSENTAKFGDSLGSLCQELGRQGGEVASAASGLMGDMVNWCETQFAAIGQQDTARNLALNLVSSMQGISLLTLSLNNPEYLEQQSNFLINWVDGIADTNQSL